jgi:hypothetical protein
MLTDAVLFFSSTAYSFPQFVWVFIGAEPRKLFSYAHIPQRWAPLINTFNHDTLFPYINYHRPCFFPKTITDSKGKDKKNYPYEGMMTPYDKLKSIENTEN